MVIRGYVKASAFSAREYVAVVGKSKDDESEDDDDDNCDDVDISDTTVLDKSHIETVVANNDSVAVDSCSAVECFQQNDSATHSDS